jgi:hypothetical protein
MYSLLYLLVLIKWDTKWFLHMIELLIVQLGQFTKALVWCIVVRLAEYANQ